jgi:UDP-hydrolysing UDP-N-acetyl-D-glucosamine 2-epimerase
VQIAVVTTSRADWNSLGMVAYELREQGADLTIMAPFTHAGRDVLQTEGWTVTLYGRHWLGTNAEMINDAYALMDLGLAWQDRPRQASEAARPDLVLLCGDRHETLSAAFAAAALGIPIAHLAGGDVSGGSSDERYRHAVTKLADVHFPTHHEAAKRIRAMGENPAMIFMHGSASIDRMLHTQTLTLSETATELGLQDSRPFILCNYQPETPTDESFGRMMDALAITSLPVVFASANPDPGAAEVNARIALFAERHPHGAIVHHNMPPVLYLSALRHAACLIGNSSSGFYEAPYYGTPVINVGNRQQGRGPVPRCMILAGATVAGLAAMVRVHPEFREVPEFLFGDGHAAPAIARTILQMDGQLTERKLFHDGQ